MATKLAADAHAEIVRQTEAFVRGHPAEKNNSAGEVVRRLTVEHTEAALWLEKNHKMVLDTYNLHSLVEFWPQARVAAKAAAGGAKTMVVTSETFGAGEFNPMHLIEYFAKNPGALDAARH